MSSLTQEELQEIANFDTAAPGKFTGLIMDSTSQGRANANSVASYVLGRGLPFTVANLDAAVIALQFVLFWAAGTAPVAPVARDTRSQRQRAHDGGITPFEPTHSDTTETNWAREIREGKEANANRLAAQKKAAERWTETHQVIQGPNGRISYAQSEALNKAAAQRHAEEDARESGKPVRVPTGFRIIPDNETNFSGPAQAPYTSAELSAYLARRKGGHLLR